MKSCKIPMSCQKNHGLLVKSREIPMFLNSNIHSTNSFLHDILVSLHSTTIFLNDIPVFFFLLFAVSPTHWVANQFPSPPVLRVLREDCQMSSAEGAPLCSICFSEPGESLMPCQVGERHGRCGPKR